MKFIDHIKRLNHRRLAPRQFRKHQQMAQIWDRLIDQYVRGDAPRYSIPPKRPELVGAKVIWQYWAQGFDQLPEVVELCYASVDRHAGDYQVIRLSDETVRDYIDLPEIVYKRRESDPAFMIAYFADILRLSLLAAYGGVWFDSTIFMAGPIDERYTESEFFMFQRDPDEPLKKYWKSHLIFYFDWRPDFRTNVQNAIIFAKPGSEVITTLRDILILYWVEKDPTVSPPIYLFFHVLFDRLVREEKGLLHSHNCRIVSDTNLEILQRMMNKDWPMAYGTPSEILEKYPLQKMSFKVDHATYVYLVDLLKEAGRIP